MWILHLLCEQNSEPTSISPFLILNYFQGYGVSMKNGLTYRQLVETVGIHPTSSEEIVNLSITKSSGEDAAAGGC
jgi:hypothetical protein